MRTTGEVADPLLAEARKVAARKGTTLRVRQTLDGARIQGPAVHEARIAALCLTHGVRELWSADRDWSRFPELAVRNPLLA